MSENKDYFVHESSYVDAPAKVGAGTKIWHFCHIMPDSEIGENCNLGQNVVISDQCRLGNNVKIQNNVSVYTGVIMEDDVFCGPSAVFTNVINPRSHVVRKDEYRQTLLKQGSSIGANATIVCGVTIGKYAFVGAGAVVTHDIPDFAKVFGNPARVRGWLCRRANPLDLSVDPESTEQAVSECGGYIYEKKGMTVTERPNPSSA